MVHHSTPDHSGLEAVVTPDLEVVTPPPQQQPPSQAGGGYYASSWQQQQYKYQPQHSISAISGQTEYSPNNSGYPYSGPPTQYYPPQQQPFDEKSSTPKKLLGLKPKIFWILIIILVIILAAGIGGGIAAGLSSSSSSSSSSTPSSSGEKQTPSSDSTSPPPLSSPGNPTPSETSSSTSPTRTPNTILPPSTDTCPSSNQSIISPLNASGTPWTISRENSTPQKFQIHCDRDMSADIRKGTIDIMRLSVRTLEECIAACAGYNFQYGNNAVYGAGRSSAGLCKAVTLVKKSGDYCFLKNGSRFDVVQSQPWLFSSAILVE
ncbi:hypothetical protein QBC38DRAFT_264765 [Podospora fimiseda]|uniref:Apple domain-containing protein n=1 Tax=Podospora fimiseda TaxID=252190 RepID=A0AAN7H126_9PEZI|nr:hypothetical protein QBC38DRAFT_264765 [Podospora fimiseda]